MITALRIVGRAIRSWYDELLVLMLFNIVWFLLLIPIVTAPIATATMYVIARRVLDRDYLEFRQFFVDLRPMVLPGLQWGFVNLVVICVIGFNFAVYQTESGLGWGLLRISWGVISLLWIAANLFYWPFWLVQVDRRLLTTYRNSVIFLLKNPSLSLSLLSMSIALAVLGTLTALPLVVVVISWLSLMSVLAVDEGLKDLSVS